MGGQNHPNPNTDPKHTRGFGFKGKGWGRDFARRGGVTADNDGDVERPRWLHQPLTELVPSRHGSRSARGPWGCSPGRDGMGWGCTIPLQSHGDGGSQGCLGVLASILLPPEVRRARWGGGTAGRWGCPRQPGEGADGAGWLLSRCHQSAPAPPSAAASPGCKSDLNEAEGFSARSGLAVDSGDSVATGRPCVLGKGRTGTSARGC